MTTPFVYRTRVRFVDTDASGRIHYTAMFRYFEAAEIEFLRSIGILYSLTADVSYPRVHVECDYKLALEHDDLLDIELVLRRIGSTSIRFEFRVMKENALAAFGAVVIVCMDRASKRAVPIPEETFRKLQPFALPR